MLNLKLRELKGLTIPVGPSFNSAQQIHTDFLGTKIKFLAPKHSSSFKSRKPEFPRKTYTKDETFFRSRFSPEFNVDDTWSSVPIFSSSWAFREPLFTGTIAELAFAMFIIKPNEINTNVSFFHPRAFETYISDFITNEYSLSKRAGRATWVAPVNWNPISISNINSVRLNVCPDEFVNKTANYYEFVFIPISDTNLLVLKFIPSQLMNEPIEYRDKLVDRSTMIELMDNIVNSIEIKLSPDAKSQQTKAFEDLADTSLVREFLPLKWTTDEDDAEWEEYKKLKFF